MEKITVYGFGKQGKSLIKELSKSYKIKHIIDNHKKYNGRNWHGIEIIDYGRYLECGYTEKIVICAAGDAYRSIKDTLRISGKLENKDYVDVDSFLFERGWQQGKLIIPRISASITTRCTLRCKNCSMMMPYVKNPVDYSFIEIKEDMDLFFRYVDYLSSLLIVGGEPFLNTYLADYLRIITSEYSTKIGSVEIITNGTVIPSEGILSLIRENGIAVRVSDYTHRVNYKSKIEKLYEVLNKNDIKYSTPDFSEWVDMGNPPDRIKMTDNVEDLKKHIRNCHVNCGFLAERALYYCCREWAAQRAFGYKAHKDDYIKLDEFVGNEAEGKRKIFDLFTQNNVYIRYCNICRGYDEGIEVESAIQMG